MTEITFPLKFNFSDSFSIKNKSGNLISYVEINKKYLLVKEFNVYDTAGKTKLKYEAKAAKLFDFSAYYIFLDNFGMK